MKEDLQCLALRIFTMCLLSCITLEVEWIPRSANDKADFFLAELWIMMIGGSRGTISFWPKKNGVLTLLTGLRTMRILSCPVLIADFGALVQRRLMPFLFLGWVRIICSFLLFFSSPRSLITWLPSAVELHLSFLLGLPHHFLPYSLIFSRSPWVLMFSFWEIIKIPFLNHLISVQGSCSCGFPREALRCPPLFQTCRGVFSALCRVLTLIPHGI